MGGRDVSEHVLIVQIKTNAPSAEVDVKATSLANCQHPVGDPRESHRSHWRESPRYRSDCR